MELTAIIKREGADYVALCPQVDIASQGSSVELAQENRTRERSDLFVTCAEIATNLDWL